MPNKISRRKFLIILVAAGISAILGGIYVSIKSRHSISPLKPIDDKSRVYIVKVEDRKEGVNRLLEQFPNETFENSVAIKANFNSNDPFPGTTHIETLESIIEGLKEKGIKEISLAERSGVGNTRRNLEELGVFDLADKYGFNIVILDELEKDDWAQIPAEGTHWLKGFSLAKIFYDSKSTIQTCCLKTHRFGGHFTMSLKNSVGMVAKRLPGSVYDYMMELHTSPFQRVMIAEINRFYKVDLVIMDAMKIFTSGGPDRGVIAEPGVILASRDRVAIDAVGVAILRLYGSTNEVMNGNIFEQEQIKRAAKLGIGVDSLDKIELVPVNESSQDIANNIGTILKEDI